MGGASTRDPARHRPDRRRDRGGALRPGDGRPRRPPAQAAQRGVRAGSSARSTRSCRRSRPSGSRRCSSSTAAARSRRGRTDVGAAPPPRPVQMALDLPDRVAGVAYPPGATARRLGQVGCAVELGAGADGRGQVVATPPSWRPDLAQPADLVEEVLRLEGYATIPSELPTAPAGRGLTAGAAPPPRRVGRPGRGGLRRGAAVPVRRAPATWDAFGLPADDPRRHTVPVRNPLDADRAAAQDNVNFGFGFFGKSGRRDWRGRFDFPAAAVRAYASPWPVR